MKTVFKPEGANHGFFRQFTACPTSRTRISTNPRPWLKHSVFYINGAHQRALSPKQRVKIMADAEALERRTKQPGKRDGVLGQSGLTLLRKMLFHFIDKKTGQLDPSYKRMKEITGFCKETISQALKRLHAAGILEVQRRIIRVRDKVFNVLTGRYEWRDFVRQFANAYMLNTPLSERGDSGDFGLPLFPYHKQRQPTGSTSQTESTSIFLFRMGAAKAARAWQAS
jgi:hypothetical protein